MKTTELETKILNTAKEAIYNSIAQAFTGYDNPLKNMIKHVIENNEDELSIIVDKSFKKILDDNEFRKELDNVMVKKMAQAILSNLSSEVQSTIDKLQQRNPVLKQEIEIAVAKLIKKYNN